MKYLCRNRDNTLVVFYKRPYFDEETGKFYVSNQYIMGGKEIGYESHDPNGIYSTLKPGNMICDFHISYLCEKCNNISKTVSFCEDPYRSEFYNDHSKYYMCNKCYRDAANDI